MNKRKAACARAGGTTVHADTTTNNIILEIRAAEGGDDAKLLVTELFGIYLRYAVRRRL